MIHASTASGDKGNTTNGRHRWNIISSAPRSILKARVSNITGPIIRCRFWFGRWFLRIRRCSLLGRRTWSTRRQRSTTGQIPAGSTCQRNSTSRTPPLKADAAPCYGPSPPQTARVWPNTTLNPRPYGTAWLPPVVGYISRCKTARFSVSLERTTRLWSMSAGTKASIRWRRLSSMPTSRTTDCRESIRVIRRVIRLV